MSVMDSAARTARSGVESTILELMLLWTWAKTAPVRTAKRELAREVTYVQAADSRAQRMLRAGQSGGQLVAVMLTITIAAAVGFVGTKVISEIDNSIEVTTGSDFDDATNNISSGFADAMGLTDVVFITLMAVVVLGALLAFRAQR